MKRRMRPRLASDVSILLGSILISTILQLSVSPSAAAQEDQVVLLLGEPDIPNLPLQFPKWQRVRTWMSGTAAASNPALAAWASWARQLAGEPVHDRLADIQRRVDSSFRYRSDQELFGVRDYWETPDEVVRLGAADCDGFAIFKFWLARNAGLPDGALAVLVGFRSDRQAMHAVLLASEATHDDVLDSLEPAVIDQKPYFLDFRPVALFTLDDIHYFRFRGSH